MRQNGIVKDTKEGMALVSLMGADGCATCSGKGGCGIFCSSGGGSREEWVANPAGAVRGDRVEVELAPHASLALAGALFVLPVVVLALSLALLPPGAEPGRTAVHAVAGLALGILSGVIVSRVLSRRKGFDLKIVSIVGAGRGD